MGGGSWSSATYAATTGSKISSGSTFGYDRHVKTTGDYKVHESLDPTKLNGAGLNIRESRDSVEHPNSLPIVVGFDSTGSMGSVPRVVQEKLKSVFTLLVDKGYTPDPQVCVATYGDAAAGDRLPLQVGQFESDNRVDDALDNMVLEGGGGGNGGETSNLLLYFLATHTATDAWEKRNKKGHIFIIADERQVPISADMISRFVGDGQPLLEDISYEGIARAVTEKWNVWILLIDNTSARMQHSEEFYSDLFGADHVLIVEDANNIAETIGAVVGFAEGTDVDTIKSDLSEVAGTEIALRVGNTLTSAGAPASGGLR
jgi:hypothetical protein